MFFDIYLWLFVINLLGLLKNKPSLIIYQMQMDDLTLCKDKENVVKGHEVKSG